MKKYSYYLFAATSLFAISCGPGKSKTEQAQQAALADTVKTTDIMQVSPEASAFVNAATQGSRMEVRLGELAQRNGLNMKVKEFGAMMEKDHGDAINELQKIAATKKISLSPNLGNEMQEKVDSLALMNSAGFDLAFMQQMVDAHKKDIAEFEKADDVIKDADIKGFIVKTLPTLKMHLAKAEEINQELDKKNKANYAKK